MIHGRYWTKSLHLLSILIFLCRTPSGSACVPTLKCVLLPFSEFLSPNKFLNSMAFLCSWILSHNETKDPHFCPYDNYKQKVNDCAHLCCWNNREWEGTRLVVLTFLNEVSEFVLPFISTKYLFTKSIGFFSFNNYPKSPTSN